MQPTISVKDINRSCSPPRSPQFAFPEVHASPKAPQTGPTVLTLEIPGQSFFLRWRTPKVFNIRNIPSLSLPEVRSRRCYQVGKQGGRATTSFTWWRLD